MPEVCPLEFNSDNGANIASSLFRSEEVYEPIEIPHPEMWMAWNDQVLKDGKLVGVSKHSTVQTVYC